MREILERRYEEIFLKYGFEKPIVAHSINTIIIESLKEFLKGSRCPAIYCNGGHTKMLMADFIYELKKVTYIVDNYAGKDDASGYSLIRDEDLEQRGIDAVIISSFKFRDDIKEKLEQKHPGIRYLDIYEKFSEKGINLQADYYYHNHPYNHYHTINTLQRKIAGVENPAELEQIYWELISHYIQIKDFRTAIVKAKELCRVSNDEKYRSLEKDLEELYQCEQWAAEKIAGDNVLMVCVDGLRAQDLSADFMPKLSGDFKKKIYSFERAYSFSTSTYESLIPVFSENQDLRTGYYNYNLLEDGACRFVREAGMQNRPIYFYTDTDKYIENKEIKRIGAFQTASEKLWSFILDACEEQKGLFYIHILYESHFTYSNPYTSEKLISEGTALLFEFLPQKGGRLRTDFERQHLDALRYLDDIVTPIIGRLNCRMVLFADHGNLILNKDTKLEDIPDLKYSCAEEWLRIPFLIKSPEQGTGEDTQLVSLMSLNEAVISLMKKKPFHRDDKEYIKTARSELYNPDFRYLYKSIGKEQYLLAFEAFIFRNGYKLAVYSNGLTELMKTESDERCENTELTRELLEKVKEDLTVCAYPDN